MPQSASHRKKLNVVLIAHDNLKGAMVEWVRTNLEQLKKYNLIATGTTGSRIETELKVPVTKVKSGPLGGDQQIGAKIVDGDVDLIIFFWDALSPHPHDVDVKALLRVSIVCDVPFACNRASADLMIRSIAQPAS